MVDPHSDILCAQVQHILGRMMLNLLFIDSTYLGSFVRITDFKSLATETLIKIQKNVLASTVREQYFSTTIPS